MPQLEPKLTYIERLQKPGNVWIESKVLVKFYFILNNKVSDLHAHGEQQGYYVGSFYMWVRVGFDHLGDCTGIEADYRVYALAARMKHQYKSVINR